MTKKSSLVLGLVFIAVVGIVSIGFKVSRNTVTAGGGGGDIVDVGDPKLKGTSIKVDELEYGDDTSRSLNFTASNTPGGLFSIIGTQDRVCYEVVIDLKTADVIGGLTDAGARLVFRTATSSGPSTFPDGGTTLIASSTIATGTTGLLSSVVNTGTYAINDADAGAPWVWTRGVYLNGAFAIGEQGATGKALRNATSSNYNGNAGRMYVRCNVR